jgi:VIT1/CCC1 family predicted Fe2+/Mn2+ transporter
MVELSSEVMQSLRLAQTLEITEYHVYSRVAKRIGNTENAAILLRIADDEKRHADFWGQFTKEPARPNWAKVYLFLAMAYILGLTFALKLLEKTEDKAQVNYKEIVRHIPEAAAIVADEHRHEEELIGMINEERLEYVGSIVLGLNDALVELTGTLAGLSFALQNSRLIGFAGLITGIAASMSMAASNYLALRSEGQGERALRSAIYTGTAYIITVILLVAPYLLGYHYMTSLAITLLMVLLIIAGFNYYLSVAKDLPFRQRFVEMAGISLSVAGLTFVIGWLARIFLGIEV